MPAWLTLENDFERWSKMMAARNEPPIGDLLWGIARNQFGALIKVWSELENDFELWSQMMTARNRARSVITFEVSLEISLDL